MESQQKAPHTVVHVDPKKEVFSKETTIVSSGSSLSICFRRFVYLILCLIVAGKLGATAYMEYKTVRGFASFPSKFDPNSPEAAELIQQCDVIARTQETANTLFAQYGDLVTSCGPLAGPPCGPTCCGACDEADEACLSNCTRAQPLAIQCCPSDAQTIKKNIVLYLSLTTVQTAITVLLLYVIAFYLFKRYKKIVQSNEGPLTCEQKLKRVVAYLRGLLLQLVHDEKKKMKDLAKDMAKEAAKEIAEYAKEMDTGKESFETFVEVSKGQFVDGLSPEQLATKGYELPSLEDMADKLKLEDEKPPFNFIILIVLSAVFDFGCLALALILLAQQDNGLLCFPCPERQKWKEALAAVYAGAALVYMAATAVLTLVAGAIVYIIVPLPEFGGSAGSVSVKGYLIRSWPENFPKKFPVVPPPTPPVIVTPPPAPVIVTPPPTPVIVTPPPAPVIVIPTPPPVIVTPTPTPVIVIPPPTAPVIVTPTPTPVIVTPPPAPVIVTPTPTPVIVPPTPTPVIVTPTAKAAATVTKKPSEMHPFLRAETSRDVRSAPHVFFVKKARYRDPRDGTVKPLEKPDEYTTPATVLRSSTTVPHELERRMSEGSAPSGKDKGKGKGKGRMNVGATWRQLRRQVRQSVMSALHGGTGAAAVSTSAVSGSAGHAPNEDDDDIDEPDTPEAVRESLVRESRLGSLLGRPTSLVGHEARVPHAKLSTQRMDSASDVGQSPSSLQDSRAHAGDGGAVAAVFATSHRDNALMGRHTDTIGRAESEDPGSQRRPAHGGSVSLTGRGGDLWSSAPTGSGAGMLTHNPLYGNVNDTNSDEDLITLPGSVDVAPDDDGSVVQSTLTSGGSISGALAPIASHQLSIKPAPIYDDTDDNDAIYESVADTDVIAATRGRSAWGTAIGGTSDPIYGNSVFAEDTL